MNNKQIFTYLTLFILVLTINSCSNSKVDSKDVVNDSIETDYRHADKSQILSTLKQNADIATTEVKIRKIAMYDSSKKEHFSWLNPSTWKYGKQVCIVPVEVTLKYGYDLRDLRIEDIKISDDSTEVAILLPKPKIIDAGYKLEIEEGSAVSISTGMRSKVGHAIQEEVRKKGYEAVLKEDLWSEVGQDVESNAKTIIVNIVKSLGWKDVQISTYSK